ncbi:MAG: hypothetical protein HC879_18920 [Leptolyngbyaceae cyanobacterium SL_5_9]|nr:hypothetical protein [Leptolyngbyaceae cyanobacterium SL_5_9]NJO74353.1 hypothetical protein [Leptolyngbyaceae cyanobacterium RM1_406_9]
MVAARQRPSSKATEPQLTPEEIYYPGRAVRWMGRYYRVQWCNGESVGITAGQGPHQSYYQYLPDVYELNNQVIPVGHVFLQAL